MCSHRVKEDHQEASNIERLGTGHTADYNVYLEASLITSSQVFKKQVKFFRRIKQVKKFDTWSI